MNDTHTLAVVEMRSSDKPCHLLIICSKKEFLPECLSHILHAGVLPPETLGIFCFKPDFPATRCVAQKKTSTKWMIGCVFWTSSRERTFFFFFSHHHHEVCPLLGHIYRKNSFIPVVTFLTPLASSPEWENSKGSIGHAFAVRIRTGNRNQTSFYPSVLHEISVPVELVLGPLLVLSTKGKMHRFGLIPFVCQRDPPTSFRKGADYTLRERKKKKKKASPSPTNI